MQSFRFFLDYPISKENVKAFLFFLRSKPYEQTALSARPIDPLHRRKTDYRAPDPARNRHGEGAPLSRRGESRARSQGSEVRGHAREGERREGNGKTRTSCPAPPCGAVPFSSYGRDWSTASGGDRRPDPLARCGKRHRQPDPGKIKRRLCRRPPDRLLIACCFAGRSRRSGWVFSTGPLRMRSLCADRVCEP